jgi:hypothetical protein
MAVLGIEGERSTAASRIAATLPVGQQVWLEFNPSHIIPIQDDPHA